MPKLAVTAGSLVVHGGVRAGVRAWDGYWDGYSGWVYRGSTTQPPGARGEVLLDSEAGPEALQGLEWWSSRAGRVRATQTTTPCGRARSAVWVPLLEQCRLWANKGEI